ncbi:MAG: PAS domain S-box protein [Candidatus Sulfotelmatobacter sp.]
MKSRQQSARHVPDGEIRYRLLFENSMDGILLTAPDGRIFDANPSACAILGRTREQIVAAGREGLLDTGDPALASMIEERKRRGKVHGELTARRPDGSQFPMEMSSVIFSDADGNEFTCMIIRDVSRRKSAEAERERLLNELTDASAKIKTLSGLLPICSSCKKIRDEAGHWTAIEIYVRDRTEADFSHGICPDCAKRLYPDHYKKTT